VDWTVSDAALVQFAFVSPDSAVVIGLGQGTATVTATSEGKSGTASVSVND
jgi:hypothetical protein